VHTQVRRILHTEGSLQNPGRWPAATREALGETPATGKSPFEIRSAYRGQEGLELVGKAVAAGKPFWMALVDAELADGLDGVETIGRLGQVDPQMIVVLCTDFPELCWQRLGQFSIDADRLLILRKPLGPIEVRQLSLALCEKWELSRIDPLTGLLNRRAFFEHFQREWAGAERNGLSLSCAMVDLDFFKKVNDSLGHAAGDDLLCRLAAVLKRQCRASDLVCRYGGEEFCVLMPQTAEPGAVNWANRTRQAVGQLWIPGTDFHASASIGVAQRMEDMASPEELVDRSDQAMLVAKQVGRDRVIAYSTISDDGNWNLRGCEDDPFVDVSARDVMATPISCLHENESMEQAGWFLLQSRTSSAPVVDDLGQLVGILSEKDLVTHMASDRDWQKPVRHVMQPNVVCYEESSALREIYDFLCRVSIRRVIVVHHRRPTGVISRGTLLRWFNNRLRIARRQERIAPGAELSGRDRRTLLLAVARRLVAEADRLHGELEHTTGAELAAVLSGTAQIQELLNDLVVYCPIGPELCIGAKAVGAATSEGRPPDPSEQRDASPTNDPPDAPLTAPLPPGRLDCPPLPVYEAWGGPASE
jgi:diguanylate cyclase (GGDEF)-like protein